MECWGSHSVEENHFEISSLQSDFQTAIMDTSVLPKLLTKLRTLTQDCIAKHQLPTARFYADKACTLSKFRHSDVYVLANIHFLNREYHRSILVLQKHGLIPYANHMGTKDISFQSEPVVLTASTENSLNQSNVNQSKHHNKSSNLDSGNMNGDKFKYLLLGMQCLLECGEYESCISMLGDSDDAALECIQSDATFLDSEPDQNDSEIHLSSLLCLFRAKALEKLSIDQRALWWFERALIFDAKNIEVLIDGLCL